MNISHIPPKNIDDADILIVDDTLENLQLLATMLSAQGYNVRKALNGQMALKAVQTVLPDLILLDIMMPEMDGYEVCRRLQADPSTTNIPIIFLSALNEAFDKVKAFEVGGVDYITKPYHLAEVLIRTRNQLIAKSAEQVMRQLNEQLAARVKARTDQLEIANAQLLEMALHDVLTGLPNRALFMECLDRVLESTAIDSTYRFAVLLLDCDRFKLINDSLGHLIGDHLLIAIAQRLSACLSEFDTLARFGGDEFAILLPQAVSLSKATEMADCLLKELAHPFKIPHGEVFMTASIGIVLVDPAHHLKPEHLLRDADTAMYRAKAAGKNRYEVFVPAMYDASLKRLQLETDLQRAVNRVELVLHYQPIISLTTGRITGFEALVRWQHPQQGLMMPDSFILIAEETGLIVPMGHWVLKEACHQLQTWRQQGLADDSFSMSVNLSVRQFAQENLIGQIDQVIAATQLCPQDLKLEITESAIMDNAIAAEALQQLRQRQIHLSIDDFGTGYSSLSYLHTFPVNSLKIDRSFVRSLDNTADCSGLVPAILGIARSMNMSVVAEGIETPEQLCRLRELGCDLGQGYLFAPPLNVDEAIRLMASTPHW
ncbi:MAG TPA: EAL domain-containing protein [Coleofasciculaceae cyanobacterium]